MATRAFTYTGIGSNAFRVVWTGILNGDDGAPFSLYQDGSRLIALNGTYGAGGSVTIQGSLEATPTNYFTLHDMQGNDLTFTSGTARLEQVQEGPLVIRPICTAGDGTTSLTVTMTVVRKGQQ